MRILQAGMWTVLAAGLAAQGSEQGFRWMGLRAGNISYDPQENMKAAPTFGGQIGMVFDQQRYGLSMEGLISRPQSDLFPGTSRRHLEASVTLMTGLSSKPSAGFWPYLGLGLGGISVPKYTPVTLVPESTKGMTSHLSFGFLHRPARGLIWGMEGRYLLTFTPKDLREIQGSALFGFSWGSRNAPPRPATSAPPAEAKVPPPPVVPPVVESAQPPAPRPAVVEAAPPPPVAVEAIPPSPPPPPIVTPAPAPVLVPVPPRPSVPTSSLTQRLDALLLGDMVLALELGRKRIEAIPQRHWTLRLEIADLPATLKNAVTAFPGVDPDLFIAPIKLQGGRTSYQLFLGDYPTKADAERAAKRVPTFFLAGGQRPRPFLGTGIPTQAEPRR